MTVTRGLIIADPWIGHILDGRKDWEMRSQATAVRGWFALIRKGSGTVVGLARLVDCGKALNQAEMIESHEHHCIPESMIRRGEVAKWVVPWKLVDVRPLMQPVPYEHLSGAVTWVTLSSEVSRRLAPYHDYGVHAPRSSTMSLARTFDHIVSLSAVVDTSTETSVRGPLGKVPSPPLPEGPRRELGQSVLSGGNIRNYHMKLAPILGNLPQDVIGGKNKSSSAPRSLIIDWGGPEPVITDVDGSKAIFRARGWVRRFFESSRAREGDIVIFTETAPYRISVRVEPS